MDITLMICFYIGRLMYIKMNKKQKIIECLLKANCIDAHEALTIMSDVNEVDNLYVPYIIRERVNREQVNKLQDKANEQILKVTVCLSP